MNLVGKICPYCKSQFKEDDDVVMCSVCEMPHHKECWIENKACTTFGCTGTIMGIGTETSDNNNATYNNDRNFNNSTNYNSINNNSFSNGINNDTNYSNNYNNNNINNNGNSYNHNSSNNYNTINNPNYSNNSNNNNNHSMNNNNNHSMGGFCTNCGTPYVEGQKFCGSCGNSLLSYTQEQSTQTSNLGQQQFLKQTQPPKVTYNQPYNYYNSHLETNIDPDIKDFILNNIRYYELKFEGFNRFNSKVSWNWASAILGLYWYAYRKMYLNQFLYYILNLFTFFLGAGVIGIATKKSYDPSIIGITIGIIIFISPFFISGMFGNYIYKRHVEKQVLIVKNMDTHIKQNYIMQKGGISNIAVFVIIGIQIVLRCILILGDISR